MTHPLLTGMYNPDGKVMEGLKKVSENRERLLSDEVVALVMKAHETIAALSRENENLRLEIEDGKAKAQP